MERAWLRNFRPADRVKTDSLEAVSMSGNWAAAGVFLQHTAAALATSRERDLGSTPAR